MTHESIRLRVLRELKSRFENAEALVAEAYPDDPLPYGFSQVKLGPMPENNGTKRTSIGIVPGDETKEFLTSEMECTFPVIIEWRITINAKDPEHYGAGEPLVGAEIMLATVQRVLFSLDRTMGDLIIDLYETGNHVDLDTYGDKTPAGIVQLSVQYRHDDRDPRTYMGG